MHWGVRNEEPTEAPKTSRRETKAQKFDIKAEAMNTRVSNLNREINQLPSGVRAYYKKAALQASVADAEKRRNSYLKDADAVRKGKLTSTQKKVIIGGIAVAAIAGTVAYGVGKESGELNSLKLRGEAFLASKDFKAARTNPLAMTKNPDLLRPNMSADEVLRTIGRPVNPMYNTPGGHMNCRRSTFTHELRRRGYDVRATTSALGWGQSESGAINALTTASRDRFGSTSLSSMVVGGRGIRGQLPRDTRSNPAKTTATVARSISKLEDILPGFAGQPNGARGEIVFDFGAFGHSMAYEMFDGKPVIFDSQKGIMYRGAHGIADMAAKWGHPAGAEITRLDDIDLDMNFLSRWATKV
jgi:hypothetical protein